MRAPAVAATMPVARRPRPRGWVGMAVVVMVILLFLGSFPTRLSQEAVDEGSPSGNCPVIAPLTGVDGVRRLGG